MSTATVVIGTIWEHRAPLEGPSTILVSYVKATDPMMLWRVLTSGIAFAWVPCALLDAVLRQAAARHRQCDTLRLLITERHSSAAFARQCRKVFRGARIVRVAERPRASAGSRAQAMRLLAGAPGARHQPGAVRGTPATRFESRLTS
jgi:hypothetical protein